MDDFDEAAFGGHTDRTFGANPGAHCLIEPGKHPEESREEFERSLRAQLRSEDDELYTLHGKAFDREVERRRLVRDEKRRLQSEALAADRKAIADARIEPFETYTLEQLSAKSGLDIGWLLRLVQACINGGEVTPAVENTLVLKGCDFMKLAKRHSAEFEAQYISAARKRAELLTREKRSA